MTSHTLLKDGESNLARGGGEGGIDMSQVLYGLQTQLTIEVQVSYDYGRKTKEELLTK